MTSILSKKKEKDATRDGRLIRIAHKRKLRYFSLESKTKRFVSTKEIFQIKGFSCDQPRKNVQTFSHIRPV